MLAFLNVQLLSFLLRYISVWLHASTFYLRVYFVIHKLLPLLITWPAQLILPPLTSATMSSPSSRNSQEFARLYCPFSITSCQQIYGGFYFYSLFRCLFSDKLIKYTNIIISTHLRIMNVIVFFCMLIVFHDFLAYGDFFITLKYALTQ